MARREAKLIWMSVGEGMMLDPVNIYSCEATDG